jgi:uncharacterized protein
MSRDELRQPLKRRGLFARFWAKRPSLIVSAYVLTACAIVGAGSWAIRTPHPFAGEPVVIAQIPPAEEVITSSTSDAEVTGANTTEIAQSAEGQAGEQAAQDEQQFAAAEPAIAEEPPTGKRKRRMVTIEEPVAQDVYRQGAGLVISPRRALTAAPVAALIETTALGPLPKVGANGKKPQAVYARPASLNVIHSDSPKIAIILGGMGLNTGLTTRAIAELPADVSLAFAPYGDNLQKQVDRARKEGHEVLLQVPLEPIGFPVNNPGPKTLMTEAGSGENLDALYWHMSRFAGYVGLVNYQGGRFLASPEAVGPLMREVKKRGLLFVEDGSLPLTATQAVAKTSSADFRKAHTVIDADPDPKAILAALQLLEQEAQTNGIAIGTGSGLEITIETLRDWAKDAAERGIIIIPVSAAFKGRLG